jgi:adenosine deaminase
MHRWTRDEQTAYLKQKGLTDLHRHFDGSIRPRTLWDLSERYYKAIPGMDFEGFHRMLSWDEEHDRTLLDYLDKFHIPLQYTQFYDNIRTIAFEIAEDAYAEGIRTLELRINPIIHRRAGLTTRQVLNAVRAGLKKACILHPDLKTGIICIAIRGHGGNMAKILLREIAGEDERFQRGIGVIGFDIAGAERPFPPLLFREAYSLAATMGLQRTVHAGEEMGEDYIWQALDVCGAQRIGHGVTAVRDPRLMKRLAEERIVLEVCLSSNVQTGAIPHVSKHPLRHYMDAGIPCALCTDNPTVSSTTLLREYLLAIEHFRLSQAEVDHLIETSRTATFIRLGRPWPASGPAQLDDDGDVVEG